eukprot:TRINITY_DN10376_c1_g1_i5.p1 TRINITY_DN10376_c1_g1~~TRINITY_DN10376_c1_g1_i5.p1  ORF type:complete len:303 (-),score=86.03 TRINITY_DN10376_c1_g1_i5:576-1484(-)
MLPTPPIMSPGAALKLRRWELAGKDGPPASPGIGKVKAPLSARLSRLKNGMGSAGKLPVVALAAATQAPRDWSSSQGERQAKLASNPEQLAAGVTAAKELKHLQEELKADTTGQTFAEKTLEVAQGWVVDGVAPAEPISKGVVLSKDVKGGFFGRLSGPEVEAELNRHATLLKGLLRDFSVVRDIVWHLQDELPIVARFKDMAEKAEADIAKLCVSVATLESKEGVKEQASTEKEPIKQQQQQHQQQQQPQQQQQQQQQRLNSTNSSNTTNNHNNNNNNNNNNNSNNSNNRNQKKHFLLSKI